MLHNEMSRNGWLLALIQCLKDLDSVWCLCAILLSCTCVYKMSLSQGVQDRGFFLEHLFFLRERINPSRGPQKTPYTLLGMTGS